MKLHVKRDNKRWFSLVSAEEVALKIGKRTTKQGYANCYINTGDLLRLPEKQ